jgi:hypothetical protein
VEIMGGKFFHKIEVFFSWMLLNRNFLKENRHYSHAGWENFCTKIFSKLLLGQYSTITVGATLLISLHLFFQNIPINWAVLTGNRKNGKNDLNRQNNIQRHGLRPKPID